MATARVLRPTPVRPDRLGGGRRRHLQLVPPDRRARRGVRLSPTTGMVLTVLLFVALFAVAVTHTLLIESQIEIDALDQKVAAEQARYESLRVDVAELESPERIMREARDRLGMVPPEDVGWLTPDEPAAGAGPAGSEDGGGGSDETPDTSWADVKPYLEPTA
ncbi:MAG: septum formation initiator family protein [Acidimicrobiia bacterium]